MKNKVADEHAKSAKDLEIVIKRIWMQKIKAHKYCKHLVHSITCRMQTVAKN